MCEIHCTLAVNLRYCAHVLLISDTHLICDVLYMCAVILWDNAHILLIYGNRKCFLVCEILCMCFVNKGIHWLSFTEMKLRPEARDVWNFATGRKQYVSVSCMKDCREMAGAWLGPSPCVTNTPRHDTTFHTTDPFLSLGIKVGMHPSCPTKNPQIKKSSAGSNAVGAPPPIHENSKTSSFWHVVLVMEQNRLDKVYTSNKPTWNTLSSELHEVVF
jgi:hypothetical protein